MQLSLSVFWACALFCSGCIKPRCEEADNINNSSIVFSFKDSATGKYLHTEFNAVYAKDSLKIFDENNQQLLIYPRLDNLPNSPSRYWRVSLGRLYNPETDANAFDHEICRNFIIKYKYNDVDTIKACFKAKKTNCGSLFTHLNVFYKNELIGATTNDTWIGIILNRK